MNGSFAFEKVVFNPVDSKTMAIAGNKWGKDTVYVYRLDDMGGTGKLHGLTSINDGYRSPAFSPDGLRLAAVSSRRGYDYPVVMITNTVDENYARRMVESFCSSIRGSPFEREILDVAASFKSLNDYNLDGSLSTLGPDMPNLRTLELSSFLLDRDDAIGKIQRYDFDFPQLTNLRILWWGPGFSFNDTVKKLVSLRTFYLEVQWEVNLWTRKSLSKVYELPSLREFTVEIPDFSLSKTFPIDALRRRVTRQMKTHVHPFSPRERLDRRLLRFGNDKNSISKELVWGFEGEDGVDVVPLSVEEVANKVYTDTINRPTATHAGTQILAFFLARYDVPFSDVEDDPFFSENLRTEIDGDDSVFLFVIGRVTGLLHDVATWNEDPDEDILKWTFRTVGGVYGVLTEEGVRKFREWFLSDDFEKDMREYGKHLREMRDNTDRDRAGWKKLIESGFVETTTTD